MLKKLSIALVFALAIGACGRKAATPKTVAKKDPVAPKANVPKAPPKGQATKPPTKPADPSKPAPVPAPEPVATAIEGTWMTECFPDPEDAGWYYVRTMTVQTNRLTYVESYHESDQCNDSEPYITDGIEVLFKITQISDSVMTHKVEYLGESDLVEQDWVLRLDGNTLLPSETAFLVDRSSADQYDFNYQK